MSLDLCPSQTSALDWCSQHHQEACYKRHTLPHPRLAASASAGCQDAHVILIHTLSSKNTFRKIAHTLNVL